MSTTPITNQGGLNTSGSVPQITGLASNLDTNAIVNALMLTDRLYVTQRTNQENGLSATNKQLTSLQTTWQQVAADAQALGSTALFANVQSVSSSDPTRVSATSSTGGGIGGYQVSVSQLANSSQKTFTYASPTQDDSSLTIDGNAVTIKAGESINDFVTSINSNSNSTVYAAATNANTVIFSDRATGAPPAPGGGSPDSTFINVVDQTPGGGPLSYTGTYRAGQNAAYSVDGGATQTSSSNVVTSAIGGVTLTFNGITTTSGAVTVNVNPPAPSVSGIQAAVQTFVTAYNAAIDQTDAQLSQKPVNGDVTQGTLFGDNELSGLLSKMRSGMYTPNAALPSGMQSLSDIGVSTGAATGASFSHDAVAGKLTINATALASAIQSNPSGVLNMLRGWSQSFSASVNTDAGPGGTMGSRIQADASQISSIANRISELNLSLTVKQSSLQAQFAALESTLSHNQAEGNWLSGQISALPTG